MRSRGRTLPITAAILFAVTAAARAQSQFEELSRELPPSFDETLAVALGDVDGDGHLDLVAGHSGQSRLFLGERNGTFRDVTATHMPALFENTNGVALGDVDGDGDPDLVLANYNLSPSPGQNRLYLNDGTGVFTDATAARMPIDNDNVTSVALGGVDGDGDLDIVFGQRITNRLYLNDGSGFFTNVTRPRMPPVSDPTTSLALGDVDGDGDLDIVCGNHRSNSLFSYGHQNRLYLNNGNGWFTDVTTTRLPARVDATMAVELGDVDGDGDLDLVLGNSHAQQNSLLINDGTGTYADVSQARMPVDTDFTHAVRMGDVDGDGDLDIVFGGDFTGAGGPDPIRLYVNDGTGTFSDSTPARMPANGRRTYTLAVGDVGNDGDLDLVVGGYREQNRLYLNDGTGRFTSAEARLPEDDSMTVAVALADVDGDGDTDLVAGNWGRWGGTGYVGERNRLYVNDGGGTFTDVTAARMPRVFDNTTSLALGDVDGDGDVDIVVGNGSNRFAHANWEQSRLYLNNGTGAFADVTPTRMPDGGFPTRAIALGDLDGDGDLDVVLGNEAAQQNRLYLNDGRGYFTDVTPTRLPADRSHTVAVVLGDVDLDGDLDIIFGNFQTRLHLNDGTGTFTEVTALQMPAGSWYTSSLALGDVDGDGAPDLVLGNNHQGNRLYLNDGGGTFTDATALRLPADRDRTLAVALGDIDGDGDLDLVSGNDQGQQNRLYLNDGGGFFTDVTATRMYPVMDYTSAVALGDVDSDGDVDLVFGSQDDRLYFNLLRQLDSPNVALPGGEYRLDVYARFGPGRQIDAALPYVSPATARIPIPPLGTIGIDLAFALPLGRLLVPQPAGVASVSRTIPNDPGLVGFSLHAQALLLQWPTPKYLTNVASDRIR